MDQDATWYGGRSRPTQHCVWCGPIYFQKKGHTHPYPILAHVYCGQMAGWMKTPLGTAVDLGPGHIVLDRVPAPAKMAQQPPPLFGRCLLWPRSHISATAELLFYMFLTVQCRPRLIVSFHTSTLLCSVLSWWLLLVACDVCRPTLALHACNQCLVTFR